MREMERSKELDVEISTTRNSSSSSYGLSEKESRRRERIDRAREKDDERLTTIVEPDPTKTHDISTWPTPDVGASFFFGFVLAFFRLLLLSTHQHAD